VFNGKTFLELLFKPLAGFVILALGAVSITAGPIDLMVLTTAFTAIESSAIFTGSAVDNGANDFSMLGWHVWVCIDVFRAECSEDIGDRSHAYTSFISESMI
jgi:hypothetical protein